jgi:hypothetical protein
MSMRRTSLITAGLLAILVVVSAGSAQAQGRPTSLAQLGAAGLVKVGDTVFVTGVDGRRLKGTIADLSSDLLSIDSSRARHRFSDETIRRIERRDSLFNGSLIGLAIGFAALQGVVRSCSGDECVLAGVVVGVAALVGGPAIGAAVDASTRKTVYVGSRPASSRLHLAPLLSRRQQGIGVQVTF